MMIAAWTEAQPPTTVMLKRDGDDLNQGGNHRNEEDWIFF